jgi:hypothetical protein
VSIEWAIPAQRDHSQKKLVVDVLTSPLERRKYIQPTMNQLIAHPAKAVALVAVFACSVSLLICAIRQDERITTQWARQAAAVAAVFLLIWCAGSVLLLTDSPLIPARLTSAVRVLKTQIGSMGGGMLITLFMSGTFLWSRPQQTDKPKGERYIVK